MKIRIFPFIILLLTCISLTHKTAVSQNHERLPDQNKAIRQVIGQITNRKLLSAQELHLFKNQLRIFNTTLSKKLLAAETSTMKLFDPLKIQTADILKYTDTAISPEQDRYRKIESIMHDIFMNPVTALTFEESLRTPPTPLATIQPEKGPGATYWGGEELRFAVTAERNCFVQVLFVIRQESKKNALLHPLVFHPEPGNTLMHLKEGDSLILGEDGSFMIEPPFGSEVILVVASDKPLTPSPGMENYPFTLPFDPGKLLAEIYGKQDAEELTLHSCFILSKPKETI